MQEIMKEKMEFSATFVTSKKFRTACQIFSKIKIKGYTLGCPGVLSNGHNLRGIGPRKK